MHLRSIYSDGLLCTVYEKSTRDVGYDITQVFPIMGKFTVADIRYDGSEGELYDLREDPLQWRNLWSDARYKRRKSDLIADMYDTLPKPRANPLPVEAPA